ncbi:MAG: GYF domain-containing protein [Kofleriaceae bacterium]
MKFLCDRCKTRYSIGDDRVRGKILKIRCKNCANVITVREGMNAEDLPEPNRGRPTTAAPEIAASAPVGALASAFAQQATKPPPALEEEWYVSIEGDQSGPFSLSEAQRWITSKPFDADVHCWSEGFDDWLPVDKVSHFRGLRKRPAAPQAPPPLPRAATRPGGAMAAAASQPREEEPKPLFAATMASLERGVPASPLTPPNGILAKATGRGSAPVPAIPSIPAVTPSNNGTGPNRAKPLAFDASEPAADPRTTVDAPSFPEPKRVVKPMPVPEPESDGTPDEDDSLDIGEVSRVVKLADLAKMSSNRNSANRVAPAPAATGRTTGSVARVSPASLRTTGSSPKFDPSQLGLAPGELAPATSPEAASEAPAIAAAAVAQAHRRGLIMLIGVAAILLIGVAVLVVVVFNRADDDISGGLGPAHTIDTSRPEELVLRQLPGGGSGLGSAIVKAPIHRPQPIPHPNGQGSAEDTGEGKGDKIKSDEIEDMARKQSAGTQRCYMRAQRGAEGIEIADLRKLSVTLTIDKAGNVADVALSDHQNGTLGQCLIGQIKHWKFRESPGGLYRIVLAFAS